VDAAKHANLSEHSLYVVLRRPDMARARKRGEPGRARPSSSLTN